MRFAIDYFRAQCHGGRHVIENARHPSQYQVVAQPPYSAGVELWSDDAPIHYKKETRENTRAESDVLTGYFIVRTDYNEAFWLEHKGKRMSTPQAAEFLLAELFELIICE